MTGQELPSLTKEGFIMKKFWEIFSWGITICAQIALSFLTLAGLRNWIFPTSVTSLGAFLIIPFSIWISFIIGFYGIGMLSMILRKIKPLKAGLRLISTAALALIPLVVLTSLSMSVGFEEPVDFRNIVLGRMVPYYTNLNVAFSLIGFYIPTWSKYVKSQQGKTTKNEK